MYRLFIKIKILFARVRYAQYGVAVFSLYGKDGGCWHSISGPCGLPAGSLGNDLYDFLKRKGLNLWPYYAKRDNRHILPGLIQPMKEKYACKGLPRETPSFFPGGGHGAV